MGIWFWGFGFLYLRVSSAEVTPKRYDLRLEFRTLGADDSFDGSLKADLDLLNLGIFSVASPKFGRFFV